jgi:hypothetical protein
MTFSFEYERPGKKSRVVQILTPYVSFYSVCIVWITNRITLSSCCIAMACLVVVAPMNSFNHL